MSEQEQVVIKYNKYSAWTVIKIAFFLWLITFIMTGGAFGLVNADIALAKASGFVEQGWEFVCRYCGNQVYSVWPLLRGQVELI